MVACCTGGVSLDNLNDFAAETSIIGVGSSFILSATKNENNFVQTITQILFEANQSWKKYKGADFEKYPQNDYVFPT